MRHLIRRFIGTVGVHEKDVTLFLWMAAYFLRYFHLRRAQQTPGASWSFSLMAASLDLDTLRFVLQKVRLEYMVAETKVTWWS
jgi:hypothetical protein